MRTAREFRKYLKRRARDRRLSGHLPWEQQMKTNGLRRRIDREEDAIEMPAPRPPKPPRRQKRKPGKPGRRM